jgi:hypothetical protein
VGTVRKIKRKPKKSKPVGKWKVSACDLFAGAGGFSLGARLAGIDVAAAIEWDKYACQTYRTNLIDTGLTSTHLFEEDISKLTPNKVKFVSGFNDNAKTDQYFVTASPACDLVDRRPSSAQSWAHSIFPLTPLVAILLEQKTVGSALVEAENGLHIFLENGADRKAFKVVQGSGQKPSYEFFMVKDEGKVRDKDGKIVFDASRLTPRLVGTGAAARASETERDWVDDTFEVVDQLKGMNGTHILQLAGQHLSRIGLDYINMPKV